MKIFFASAIVVLLLTGCSTTAKHEPLVTYKPEAKYERVEDKMVTADVVFHEYQDGEFVTTIQAPSIAVLEGEDAEYILSSYTVSTGQQNFPENRRIKYEINTQPHENGSLEINTLLTNTESLSDGIEIIHQHEGTQTIWYEGIQTVGSPL